MSYYVAQGFDVSELVKAGVPEILEQAGPGVEAAARLVEDPALPEVACQILRLEKIHHGESPGSPCPLTVVTKSAAGKGVGLSAATTPLRAFVWTQEHPVAAWSLIVGAVGLIWAIGFSSGRLSK